jgi:hypothetical protein
MPTKETKGSSGANLVDLQKRLNTNTKLRNQFLANPGETLRNEGVQLTPEQERSVAYLVDQVKKPGRLVPGAGIAPQDLRAITITIGVDF